MRKDCEFYICPICFKTSDEPGTHHEHEMIFCKSLPLGDDQLKPIRDLRGDLKSRAPRWFLEAVWDEANIDYGSKFED
jgi:hypothetical protein